jgi:protein-S-isoprenylcysteine O-methyltransferase Ste14
LSQAAVPDSPSAPPGARTGAAVSVAAWLLAAAAMIGLYLSHALLGAGPVAIAVQASAVLLMLWARWIFGRRSFHAAATPTAGGLVTTGPYRYLRHPIYAAVIYFTWAGAASHARPATLTLAAVATLGLGIRMALEERYLRRTYPDYAIYAAATARLLPGLF